MTRKETLTLSVMLALVILLAVLIWRGWPQPEPPVTPTVPLPPYPTEMTPTLAPVVSPTLTIVPQTATATVTVSAEPSQIPQVTHTAMATVAPTSTPVYRIIRDCAPRYAWQACYWRCCDGR